MDCCGLSSTGLQNIDANELTADNATIFSNLNISGYSFLNNVLIKNNTTLLSSLNVSGFTMLNNNTTLLSSLNVSGFTMLNNNTTLLSSLNVSGFTTLNATNINGQLNVSGLNVLQTLNNFNTNLTTLFDDTINTLQIVNNHTTDLTLINSLINVVDTSTAIHGVIDIIFDTPLSNTNAATGITSSAFLTKIDSLGKLNVYHHFNALLPTKFAGFWIVHDEIEGFHQQAIINAAKFLLHDGQIDAVGAVATGAANGVASIALYLGFSTLDAFLTGGGNGGINTRITNNENNLYNLSSASTLSINTLNNTTTSILGYINGYTAFSSLQTNILNVSGFTTLNNNATLLSSLNVSGFTTLNNNTTLLSSLNVSGFSTLNNNTTLLSSLNVSGNSTLRSITLNKNNVDSTGDSLNFYYNNPGTYFTDNGYSSYFSLNSNCVTNTGVAVEPFIRVYNRMFKNGANTAMDLKTFGNSNNNVNSDVLIRLDSGGDPTPGTNSGKIIYNINGLDKHIMTSTGLGINVTSPGIFALNVNGDSILSNLKVSGSTTLNNNTTLLSSLNISGFTILNNNTTLLSSLNVSGFTTLNNNTSIFGTLNVSGFTILNNNTTLLSSLNISGVSTLNNNTTLLSSINVSGFTTLNNNSTIVSTLNVSGFTTLNNNTTIVSSMNISGFTTLNNNTTIVSSMNISGFATLNNNTTIISSMNISGFATLNNKTTLLSSLNVSGRTIIGSNIYDYSDSLLEVHKNLNIRNNITNGDRINLQVGTGTRASYLSMEEGYDINIVTSLYGTSQSGIRLASNKQINLEAPDVYVNNNLNINGIVTGINIGVKTPIYFTTNRNMTIDGVSFSVYDIDLRKYTKSITLDGYNIRQFRIRHWPADADFETGPSTYQYNIKRYDIFMSSRNGLKLYSLSSPLDNQFLTETIQTHFLYRNTFDYLTYCSRYGAVKVYFIIEDLL